jgi:hypothetical protein
VWNRIAPDTPPSSASPQSGRIMFTPVSEEIPSPVNSGVEKMKDLILEELPSELKPQSWFYRVRVTPCGTNCRSIVLIEISKVKA